MATQDEMVRRQAAADRSQLSALAARLLTSSTSAGSGKSQLTTAAAAVMTTIASSKGKLTPTTDTSEQMPDLLMSGSSDTGGSQPTLSIGLAAADNRQTLTGSDKQTGAADKQTAAADDKPPLIQLDEEAAGATAESEAGQASFTIEIGY